MSISSQITLLAQRIGHEFKSRFNALAAVATSGAYADLTGAPTIATQVDAEGGIDDTKIMTPAKVKAVVNASQAVVNNEVTTYKLLTVGGVLALIQQ